jgi:dienelactone hydrolase
MNLPLRLLPLLALAVPLAAQTPLVPAGGHVGPSGTLIQLNDFGSGDIAYFSIPETAPKGGVIVLHDQWGLTDQAKAAVDRLAAAGYIAVARDLFNGQLPADADRAAGMARDLARDSALRTVAASVLFLRESPRFRVTRVAVVGWGMGGGLAWDAAAVPKGKTGIDGAIAIGVPTGVNWKNVELASVPLLEICEASSGPGYPAEEASAMAAKRNIEFHGLPAGLPPERVWPLLPAFLSHAFTAPAAESLLDRMNPFRGVPPGSEKAEAPKAVPVSEPGQ